MSSFCPACGSAVGPGSEACANCGESLTGPASDDIRRSAINFALLAAAFLLSAGPAVIMLIVALSKDLAVIPVVMELGIAFCRVGLSLAVVWFARLLGRDRPWLLGALALVPLVDVGVCASLLLEANRRSPLIGESGG